MPAARLNSHVQKQHSKRANESIPAQIGDSFKLVILNISSCGALWRGCIHHTVPPPNSRSCHERAGSAQCCRSLPGAAELCMGSYARMNTKNHTWPLLLFPFLSWMFSGPINVPGCAARPLFWHLLGRSRKKPQRVSVARQGFPNFQHQGATRLPLYFMSCTFLSSFPFFFFFNVWFLITLAAAHRHIVLTEHVSCVEARGGEFASSPLAKKSALCAAAACQHCTQCVRVGCW